MSNDVCGYITPSLNQEGEDMLNKYIFSPEIGISKITSEFLYNFPKEFIPSGDVFSFLIGERPGYSNATYLIDCNECDPETSDIGFPPEAKERLNIILGTLVDMIKLTYGLVHVLPNLEIPSYQSDRLYENRVRILVIYVEINCGARHGCNSIGWNDIFDD